MPSQPKRWISWILEYLGGIETVVLASLHKQKLSILEYLGGIETKN